MTAFLKKHIILSFLLCGSMLASPVFSQKKYTEEEVNTEKIFIEASREKVLGNYENAVALFKEVLKRDKGNHAAAYELARMYDVLDKDEKAQKAIKLAISLNMENEWYQMFLGDIYEKVKNDKEAAKVYKNLLKSEPNNEYYYYKLAFYLVRSNDAKGAIKVYDQLESKFGISEQTIGKKHSLYLGLGKQNKATKELQKLTNTFPSNIEYKHMLASHFKRIGDTENAKKTFQEILKINPEDAQANLALIGSNQNDDSEFGVYGDLLNHSGRSKEALGKYMKTLELDKSVFTVWEQVMYLNFELQDFDALLQVSNDALDVFPNKVKAYYLNGIANSEKGNYQDAVDVFQQALMMSAKNPLMQSDIYGRLGEVYFNLKKYDHSDKNFEKALKGNPKSFSILDSYAYHLAQRGEQLEKAEQMAKRANELNPNNAQIQDTYAWVFYKMKNYENAKEWLEKSLKNGGKTSSSILEHYGDILYQLNEKDQALIYWQKAQEKGSTSEILEKKIADKKLHE